jgi:hypothetical protein
MSIWDKDASFDDSTPFELVTVNLVSETLRYTTYHQDIKVNNLTYKAVPIKHDNPEYEIFKDDAQCVISVPYTENLSKYFINNGAIGLVTAEIWYCNIFITDPDSVTLSSTDYIVIWTGIVSAFNCALPWFELTTTNVFSSTARLGVRRRYSRTCPYPLYGTGCKVSRTDYTLNTTVSAYSGNTLNPAIAITPNIYRGGYCSYLNKDTQFRVFQFIISNSDTQIVLSGLVKNPVIGSLLQLYQGCNHTIEDCISKYNNRANCGAFPLVPVKNLFGVATNHYF